MPPCVCCGPAGPPNCSTKFEHRCSCSETEISLFSCKAKIHNCVCLHGNGCRSEDGHYCCCEKISHISCLKTEYHACTCEKNGTGNCRCEGEHACVCEKYGPGKCRGEEEHACTCEKYGTVYCKCVYIDFKCDHECVCVKYGAKLCKNQYGHKCVKGIRKFYEPKRGGGCEVFCKCYRCGEKYINVETSKEILKELPPELEDYVNAMV